MRRVALAALAVSGLLAPSAAADQTPPTPPTPQASGNLGPPGASSQIAVPTGQPSTPAPSGGSGPCPAAQVSTYVTETSGGQPLVAQAGDVNPLTGQPVAVGSTMVDIYCNGQYASTIVVGPGGAATPPAPAEVAALTPFPAATIHHVPCYAGLTGLNSGLWATVNGGPIPPITAKATIRGYTVSVMAHPVAYHWDMGNGNVMLGTASGSQDDPSIDYTYQKSGTYVLSLTVTWTGTYTFGGNGIASQTSALGPVDQAPQHLSWPVQQIRSVLIAPGSSDTTTTTTAAVANGC